MIAAIKLMIVKMLHLFEMQNQKKKNYMND